ncbi:hypothetical protein PHSC3_000045 [Chlamydiales bacterium STE3]|nr:hypothetical protein PHSC3_000045 [Chlamydiales bacterium STE3]
MLKAEVVVRAAGERSLPLCLQAIKEQVENFTLIEEKPFIKAITKTFEIGQNSNCDILIAIDADIILNKNAIDLMLTETESMLKEVPNLFQLDFPLIDKFRGTCLGCHVYVNKHSPQFYEYFKNIAYDPKETRPEKTNVIKLKEQLGLTNTSYHIPVGLHDYEQYYSHIYVKYYRRAVRQKAFIPEIIDLIVRRRNQNPEDLDFAVALYGLYEGEGKEEIITDANFYPKIEDLLGIKEKEPLF